MVSISRTKQTYVGGIALVFLLIGAAFVIARFWLGPPDRPNSISFPIFPAPRTYEEAERTEQAVLSKVKVGMSRDDVVKTLGDSYKIFPRDNFPGGYFLNYSYPLYIISMKDNSIAGHTEKWVYLAVGFDSTSHVQQAYIARPTRINYHH